MSTSPSSTSPPADHVTCPYGHTFPTTQLTVRSGQYVCPVCDGARWAAPTASRTWNRRLLILPMVVAALAALLEVGVNITTIGLGSVYLNQSLPGTGWLVFNGAVSLVGMVLVVGGLLAIARVFPLPNWSRRLMAVPVILVGAGVALSGIGGLVGIGFNVSLLNVHSPGASWQMAGQVLDSLSQLILGLVGIWIGVLLSSTSDGPVASATGAGEPAEGITREAKSPTAPAPPAPSTPSDPPSPPKGGPAWPTTAPDVLGKPVGIVTPGAPPPPPSSSPAGGGQGSGSPTS